MTKRPAAGSLGPDDLGINLEVIPLGSLKNQLEEGLGLQAAGGNLKSGPRDAYIHGFSGDWPVLTS